MQRIVGWLKILAFVFIVNIGFNAPHSEMYMYSKGDIGFLDGRITQEMSRMIIGDNVRVVVVNSQGGNMLAALMLAEQIASRGIITLVGPGEECSSACLLVYYAGVKRVAAATAEFGFHSPFIDDPDMSDEDYNVELEKARIVMADVLEAAGMDSDFIESWLYLDDGVDYYSAEELYDMGYIDVLIGKKKAKNKRSLQI